jgi:hypothetical protein
MAVEHDVGVAWLVEACSNCRPGRSTTKVSDEGDSSWIREDRTGPAWRMKDGGGWRMKRGRRA